MAGLRNPPNQYGTLKTKVGFFSNLISSYEIESQMAKKIIFFGHDHIEKFFTIRVPNPPNQYGTKHFNFFLSQILKLIHLTTKYNFGQVSKLIGTTLKVPLKLT